MFFFFNDTAPTEIYTLSDTLSLHDALPISHDEVPVDDLPALVVVGEVQQVLVRERSEEHTSELQSPLNISYAVCCSKKKTSRCTACTAASIRPSSAAPSPHPRQ